MAPLGLKNPQSFSNRGIRPYLNEVDYKHEKGGSESALSHPCALKSTRCPRASATGKAKRFARRYPSPDADLQEHDLSDLEDARASRVCRTSGGWQLSSGIGPFKTTFRV